MNSRLTLNIIWISVIFTICKERNRKIFHYKTKQLISLSGKDKLQTFWWLKLYYIHLILTTLLGD